MVAANQDIRMKLKKAGIPLWRLGVRWGCSEVTVIRRLRLELSDETRDYVFKLIDEIKAEDELDD